MLSCTNSASSQTMACAHEADGGPPPAPDDTDGNSLYRFVDTTGIRCLNERVSGSGKNCIKPFAQKAEADPFVESNEDNPELLLFVPFTEVVKVRPPTGELAALCAPSAPLSPAYSLLLQPPAPADAPRLRVPVRHDSHTL